MTPNLSHITSISGATAEHLIKLPYMHNAIALVPELVCIAEMMYDMANDGSLAKEFAGKVLNSIAKTN